MLLEYSAEMTGGVSGAHVSPATGFGPKLSPRMNTVVVPSVAIFRVLPVHDPAQLVSQFVMLEIDGAT